jgi:hypothetical protein
MAKRHLAIFMGVSLSAGVGASLAETPQARLANARFVALGYELGDRVVAENDLAGAREVSNADREALRAVREMLEKWGRLKVMLRPQDADILVTVYSGHFLAVSLEGTAGGREPRQRTRGHGIGFEFSSPEDMLSVYEVTDGLPGQLLWRAGKVRGFSDPDAALLEALRSAVEEAARRKP